MPCGFASGYLGKRSCSMKDDLVYAGHMLDMARKEALGRGWTPMNADKTLDLAIY